MHAAFKVEFWSNAMLSYWCELKLISHTLNTSEVDLFKGYLHKEISRAKLLLEREGVGQKHIQIKP